MVTQKYCYATFLTVFVLISFSLLCAAQDAAGTKPDKGTKKQNQVTTVTVLDENGRKVTQLEIELQNAPDNMEPAAEPRRIRVDDRANVRLLVKNLSPLDVCSRTATAPTPTVETPVAESLVGTIAKLGGIAIGTSTASLTLNSSRSEFLARAFQQPTMTCDIQKDPEYQAIVNVSKEFFPQAKNLIGMPIPDGQCRNDKADQVEIACEIDSATRILADVAGRDYRGTSQADFKVENNPELKPVRDAYMLPLKSVEVAGKLQAMVDEMAAWDVDLHKKYDFTVSAVDSSSASTLPPIVPGALTVAPTMLSFSSETPSQVVHLSSGGKEGTFTAMPSSDTGWLLLSKPGGSQTSGPLKDTAPARGTFDLLVAVNPVGLSAKTHYGLITITGTGPAKGTTIVNVTVKPAAQPSECELATLRAVDEIVDRAKAEMALLASGNTALGTAQASLKTAYMALLKVEDDFKRRKDQKIVYVADGILNQPFNLGTDRKATSSGYISCVSDIDGKTPTTTNINYSLLYQDIPHWSASVGLLMSFQEKKVIGIANESVVGSSSPTNMQIFAVTDRAQVQFVPMAYVNYRIFHYGSSHYGKGKEDELVWTTHLSGGFGVNPNTGTNQPEFFAGLAVGLNRFMLHPGVHFGRTESLGGGYSLNQPVPQGVSTTPISWSYHPAFSIGFSVRLAPY